MHMSSWWRVVCVVTVGLALLSGQAAAVQLGSKRFTESYVLGELVRQTLQQVGVKAEHQQGLGNRGILA